MVRLSCVDRILYRLLSNRINILQARSRPKLSGLNTLRKLEGEGSRLATKKIKVIGGGLAGPEAALQAAALGCQVTLHEMRPHRSTEAHQTSDFAELVCS